MLAKTGRALAATKVCRTGRPVDYGKEFCEKSIGVFFEPRASCEAAATDGEIRTDEDRERAQRRCSFPSTLGSIALLDT
jgi:hypothetical protein